MSKQLPPIDELLSAYLDDELAPEERSYVESALAENPAAQETLLALGRVRDRLQHIPYDEPPDELASEIMAAVERSDLLENQETYRIPTPGRVRLKWVASIILVVGMGGGWMFWQMRLDQKTMLARSESTVWSTKLPQEESIHRDAVAVKESSRAIQDYDNSLSLERSESASSGDRQFVDEVAAESAGPHGGTGGIGGGAKRSTEMRSPARNARVAPLHDAPAPSRDADLSFESQAEEVKEYAADGGRDDDWPFSFFDWSRIPGVRVEGMQETETALRSAAVSPATVELVLVLQNKNAVEDFASYVCERFQAETEEQPSDSQSQKYWLEAEPASLTQLVHEYGNRMGYEMEGHGISLKVGNVVVEGAEHVKSVFRILDEDPLRRTRKSPVRMDGADRGSVATKSQQPQMQYSADLDHAKRMRIVVTLCASDSDGCLEESNQSQ